MNQIASENSPALGMQARSLSAHANAGTVAVEQERAVAEAQGKLVVAQRCPRNPDYAYEELMRACQSKTLAEVAFYSYSRGGGAVSGPSIRLAEEIARCWGNFEYGIKELSQKEGVSEMQAFAWDLQTNTLSTQNFTVRHIRDTKQGPKPLLDQRDIYELTANMGGRRLRSRILAVMPKWLVEAAVEECQKTLAANVGKTLDESRRALITAFSRYGITAQQIEARIGHELVAITAEEIVELRGVFQAIKDGVSSVADQFPASSAGDAPAGKVTAAAITAQAEEARPAVEAPAPEPGPLSKKAASGLKALEACQTETDLDAEWERLPTEVCRELGVGVLDELRAAIQEKAA
jgi:hypothetical protein